MQIKQREIVTLTTDYLYYKTSSIPWSNVTSILYLLRMPSLACRLNIPAIRTPSSVNVPTFLLISLQMFHSSSVEMWRNTNKALQKNSLNARVDERLAAREAAVDAGIVTTRGPLGMQIPITRQ